MQDRDQPRGQGRDTACDPWRLRTMGIDPRRARLEATLFALANGSLGVRAEPEEALSPPASSFMAGAYLRQRIHYHERLAGFARTSDTRVPVADGTRIEVWLGERRLNPDACEVLHAERCLDLREGRLQRVLRLRTAEGEVLAIHAERVLPPAVPGAPDLLGIRYTLSSETYRGPLRLVSCLNAEGAAVAQGDDPRIGAGSGGCLQETGGGADADGAWLSQAADGRDWGLHCAQRHRTEGGLRFTGIAVAAGHVTQVFEATLAPGMAVTLEKTVAYAAGTADGAPGERVAAVLEAAGAVGFDALAARAAEALQTFWEGAALSVPGDAAIEQALRFNLFHVLQSAGRNGVDGTAAKGLTGEGYEGHCFWDTEMFVLPVMVYLAPDVARAMLSYRQHTLEAARAHAREMNHPCGALYPWRTIAGDECSAHYPSGSAAYHINGAVAHAIGLYLDATGDLEFLAAAGAEMLFETARIWPQIGRFDPRRGGAFCLYEVTGPDEYTALVDNNHYTNRMAQRHLRRAADVWALLREARPEAHAALAARLALDEDEVALWRRAADAMHLGEDAALGIYAQDDAFLGRPHWPFPPKRDGHRPLLLDYHPLTLYRHQICKQADVVMALTLGEPDVTPLRAKRSFDYYEALTTHDSTLSAAVHGIAAAAVGEPERALGYFLDSLRVDLDDLHGNTGHGVHMAAMAGSWQGLAHGFGGLRIHGGMPAFAPMLPPGWPGYGFSLRWRGCTLAVDVAGDEVTYRLIAGDGLRFAHEGETLALAAGAHAVRALAHSRRPSAFPMQCEALIFDLDGVLTDTAHTHYQAWKRLADEIGVPFDASDNDALKGVDRTASLELLLARSDRAWDAEEKHRLAERKNGYYVDAITAFGPQDLFPGAHALLESARARGLRIGLASASRNAPRLLEQLGIAGLFDYIADPARVPRGKPHPDLFLDAARGLGVAPVACIGIEDAPAGVEALRAACIASVGIGDAHALRRADTVVPAIADLQLDALIARTRATHRHGATGDG